MSLTSALFNSGLFNGGLFANSSSNPTTWDLTVVTTGESQDYTVDINNGIGINIYIDWGDTSSNTYTTTGQKTHTYTNSGTYSVKISGGFSSEGNIRLGSNSGNQSRLKAVSPVPDLPGFTSLNVSLKDCTGITVIPNDLLKYVTQVTSLSYFMNGCTGLTGSIPTDLLKYVTQVTSLRAFMYGCTGLTGSIPTDLLKYVTQVTNLIDFMRGCTGLNTTVPADLLRYVTNCTNFDNFASDITWTTASYSALINSMDTYLTKTGVPFSGGFSKYDTSASAAHTNLTSVKGWTITDAGPA